MKNMPRRSSMPWVWSAWSCVKSTPSMLLDARGQQLLAQVGRRVDQDRGRAPACRRARPAARSAGGGSSGCRDRSCPSTLPTRGTPPDEPQPRIVKRSAHAGREPPSRGALAYRRKKLSVVARGDLGGRDALDASASSCAVSTT